MVPHTVVEYKGGLLFELMAPKQVPDLPEMLADFEQSDARPFYEHCSHICMYEKQFCTRAASFRRVFV